MRLREALRAVLIVLCLMCCVPSSAATPPDEALIAPDALRQDLRFLREEIDRIHPDPGLFTSRETLRKAYEQVDAQLRQPLTRDQAWRVFATLNPVFADGHMFVVHPDWKALTRAHLAAGGTLFPYEVQLSPAGEIAIRTELGGGASPLAGVRIDSINGVPAAQVAAELLARTAGDTPALRANLLSRRMWFYYWKMYGAPRQFDLVLARPDGAARLRVAGSGRLPDPVDMDGPEGFRKTFQFQLLPQQAALLTINQFQWPDRQAFKDFTREAFTRLRDAKVRTLLIDVRGNTGGDDDMWKEGILPYIADKPFRNASSYVKKVIAGRARGDEKVGEVVHGFGDTWVQPEPDNPLRFTGQVYVLVGRITYSSAVVFSNVVQDFGFARLAGSAGYARTRQTGGVRSVKLPHTGLEITVPFFVIDRPSGEREPVLVHPDIVLPDSPFDAMVSVKALLGTLHDGRGAAP